MEALGRHRVRLRIRNTSGVCQAHAVPFVHECTQFRWRAGEDEILRQDVIHGLGATFAAARAFGLDD